VLFHCFGRPVYSFPVMVYLGLVLGTTAQLVAAQSKGMDATHVLAATAIMVTIALCGARLLHVAAHWRIYRGDPRRVLAFGAGGASMYGGLLLGFPASILVLRALGLPFGAYWDSLSFTMLIGLAVGRLGCFLNGCCCGRATVGRLAIHAPDYRGIWLRRVPMQALEALLALSSVIAIERAWSHLPFDGAAFLLGLGLYAGGRALLEPFRDRPDRIARFRLQRVLSFAFLAAAFGGLASSLV
jgi:phosphatidylglycerol:prolipoprotein diacylglycerol transferase